MSSIPIDDTCDGPTSDNERDQDVAETSSGWKTGLNFLQYFRNASGKLSAESSNDVLCNVDLKLIID